MTRPWSHLANVVRKTFSTLAVAAIAGVLLLAAPSMAKALTFDSGHIDAFNVSATSDGGLALNLKEDITGSQVVHAPEEIVISVSDDAYTDGTANISGIDRPTWLLPQTQVSTLPWPGWDTSAVRSGGFESIDISLVDVSGPGTIFLYQQDTFGDLLSVTTDGAIWIGSGSVINQASPAHVHANWAFDAPGTYSITAVASGVNAEGTVVESNAATYTFEVGSGSISPENTNSDGGTGGAQNSNSAPANAAGSAAAGSNRGGSQSSQGRPAAGSSATKNGKQSTTYHGSTQLTANEEDSGWSWWTWVSLIVGVVVLIAGAGFLYFQLRQERQ